MSTEQKPSDWVAGPSGTSEEVVSVQRCGRGWSATIRK